MFWLVSTSLWLALLTAGHAEECPNDEASQLQDLYKNKCNTLHPEGEGNMEVYGHNMKYYCHYYCWNSETTSNGVDIWADHNKENGIACTDYMNNDESEICFNGDCTPESDIDLGQKALGGEKLAEMDINECNMKVTGDNGTELEFTKPEGASCVSNINSWRDATCTSYGYCKLVTHTIDDDDDDSDETQNDLLADAMCQRRYQGNGMNYRLDPEDSCGYLCYEYLPDTGYTGRYMLQAMPDGTPSGDDYECLGGSSRSIAQIQSCEDALGDPPEQMEPRGCNMMCVGSTKAMAIPNLPTNSTCYNPISPNNWDFGTCNEDSECVANEDEGADDDSKKKKK